MACTYAPELQIKGMAAVAPPTDLVRLFARGVDTTEGRNLTSYVLKTWSLKFGTDLAAMVDRQVQRWVNTISAACVNNLSGEINAFKAEQKLRDAFILGDPLQSSPWRKLIHDNSLRGFTATMPNLVFQGSANVVVHPDVTATAVRNGYKAGAVVKFVMLPGQGHSSSALKSVSQAVSWIQDRFAGRKAPSSYK